MTPTDTDLRRALPDHLASGLRLVFVGMNPGLTSARRGHYYAGPGNLFWRALHESGLTPRLFRPDEDHLLPSLGIGVTDVVGRATRGIAALEQREWREGAAALAQKLARFEPYAVCFNGLAGAQAALGRHDVRPGLQAERFAGALTFAVPSTSRRQAAYSPVEVIRWFQEVAIALSAVEVNHQGVAAGTCGVSGWSVGGGGNLYFLS
jgi:TDG/mug DNA glycosylase family protein